jgi:hypothetical protein
VKHHTLGGASKVKALLIVNLVHCPWPPRLGEDFFRAIRREYVFLDMTCELFIASTFQYYKICISTI